VTGRLVVQMSTSNLKTVTLELGGKVAAHHLRRRRPRDRGRERVRPLYQHRADLLRGNALLVQDSIYDRFLERFVERSNQIKVGNPLDFATRMGPLVSEEQLRKVERYVQIGQREGARLVCGGGRPKDAELANGFYHEPTVFADVTNQMQIAQEEIFGPVGSVIRFSDEDDAVRIGNDVIYGLAAGVQTRDVKRAHRIAKRLQAGTVWINTWHKIRAQLAVRRLQAVRLRSREQADDD
jgi:acyl-CoA reductase-like NAD-dependent aldehyde dehydrogenase